MERRHYRPEIAMSHPIHALPVLDPAAAFEAMARALGRSRDGVAARYYGAVKTRAYEARYQGDDRDRIIRAGAIASARKALAWARQEGK
jgi:hypothetical protein